jgi:Na+/citrate or Na+/malate symporter
MLPMIMVTLLLLLFFLGIILLLLDDRLPKTKEVIGNVGFQLKLIW